MNVFLKNLERLEFVITYSCTGKCKHCSEGGRKCNVETIDKKIVSSMIPKLKEKYDIKSVMTFGGEPLLYPESVCEILFAAYKADIPKRQLITNGYFSKNPKTIRSVAESLLECKANDVLLSADAFHQEYIPIEHVLEFAKAVKSLNIPIKMQPAWLVSVNDNNPFNKKTREILKHFTALDIEENEGNVVFPEGNALKYLSEYFDKDVKNPYYEDPRNLRTLSFSPDGSVLNGNIYEKDIFDIIKEYKP